MRPENGPITGQIVKIIHDDSNKQVYDLKEKKKSNIFCNRNCARDSENSGLRVKISHFEHSQMAEAYQESTEHVEADEVDNGKATATGPLLPRVVV